MYIFVDLSAVLPYSIVKSNNYILKNVAYLMFSLLMTLAISNQAKKNLKEIY